TAPTIRNIRARPVQAPFKRPPISASGALPHAALVLGLTVNEAILRGRMLDGEGLYWIEEPVRHDDYAGCARIAAELGTPIQIGENLVDTFELINALEAEAMDYVMPDLQRIGGVTGWLRAAAITQAHGMEMSSH